MRDRIFWKVIAICGILGLFAVAVGLCKNSHMSIWSLSSLANAADIPQPRRVSNGNTRWSTLGMMSQSLAKTEKSLLDQLKF